MSCSEVEKWLDDYVDGELSEETRRSVEEHLRTCLSCNRALTELRSLLECARRLPTEIEPEKGLWPGIESRIATPLTARVPVATARPAGETAEDRHHASSRWKLRFNPLAVAAVLLLAVAVPLTIRQLGREPDQAAALPGSPGSENPTAEMTTAILARSEDGVLLPRTDLLETLERQRDILSPETLATIEENAQLIDQAIAQVRTALNRSPGNRRLELLLAARYQQEVALLKRLNQV